MIDNFYSLDSLLSKKAKFNILFGERANGKSFAVKKYVLEQAVKGEKFVYIRRWREDVIGSRIEGYWEDMEKTDNGLELIKEITKEKYDCIQIYRSEIFFAKRDENSKKIRGEQIGRAVALTGDTHEKSYAYVGYYNIIYEEFITDGGYLANEVSKFMSLISTILRRRTGKIFMIGNTLTKTCPFFREWELINVPKQKQNTIDIYHHYTKERDNDENEIVIDIAVEYCANTGASRGMIINNRMITKGEWASSHKEHLPLLYKEYDRVASILIDDELEYFAVDLLTYKSAALLYVRCIEKKWVNRDKFDVIITDKFSHEVKYVKTLKAFPKLHKIYIWLYESGNVCYSDNLTGTTFLTLLNNRKIW